MQSIVGVRARPVLALKPGISWISISLLAVGRSYAVPSRGHRKIAFAILTHDGGLLRIV